MADQLRNPGLRRYPVGFSSNIACSAGVTNNSPKLLLVGFHYKVC